MFSKRRYFFIKLIGLFSLFLNLELGSDIWASNDSNEERPSIEIPINKKFKRVQQDMQDIMNYLTSVQNQPKISVQKRPQ